MRTQVETIGDAYMVAAGLLETSKNHAEAVTNMAFDMREEARKVTKPTSDDALQVKLCLEFSYTCNNYIVRTL